MQLFPTVHPDYVKEMLSLKTEISQLKVIITSAMDQIKQALASLNMTPHTTANNAMDTEGKNTSSKHQNASNNPHM